MTWIHIPITSSTASADTADSASDSDSPSRTPTSKRSAISSGTNIASKSSSSGSAMTHPPSIPLPSGTTSSPLTDDPGVERWISSVLASRVNPTQTPDSARAPMITGTSGPTPSESLGKWDQDSSFWRTCQASLWEMVDGHHMAAPWSDSWPRSGMTRSGELFPLPMQERHTSETGGGSWHIPTPTSADVYTGNMEYSQQSDDSMHSVSLPDFVHRWPTPTSTERPGTNPNTGKGEGLSKTVKMWPTPDAYNDPKSGGSSPHQPSWHGSKQQIHLHHAAKMFPTPRAGKTTDEDEESWLARHADGKVATPPLALAARMLPTPRTRGLLGGSGSREMVQAMVLDGTMSEEEAVALLGVKLLPTPTSRDHKDGDAHSCQNVPVNGLLGREVHSLPTPNEAGGSLSPDWVSWLMGIPVGWTSMEPLSREEYDEWLQMQRDGTWWAKWWGPWWFDCPATATGIPDRVNRLKCLGNGIVPASLALFLRGTQ